MSNSRFRTLTRRPSRNPADRRPARRRLSLELLEPRTLLATIFVDTAVDENTPGDGFTSLREAILQSNGPFASSAPNLIVFAIPNPNPAQPPPIQKISLNPALGPLPAITSPLIIDGYSQAGSVVNPPDKTDEDVAAAVVQIDGKALLGAADGLTITTSNCTIDGLIITGFSGSGVSIADGATPAQGNLLYGNFIGTLPNPIVGGVPNITNGHVFSINPALSNSVAGVKITSSNNRVGGNTPGSINVIANNGAGVIIDQPRGTGNLIQGNFILDNAAQGVIVRASNNTIGQALVGGGNVISGNGAQGIEITGGATVQGNGILGNVIGPDLGYLAVGNNQAIPLGISPRLTVNGHLGNGTQGIWIENSPRNFIGTTDVSSRNVIGGNTGDGIVIDGPASTGNRVLNSYVGFNIVSGLESLSLGNQNGIVVTAPGNTIGTTTTAAGNTIDHNRGYGLLLGNAEGTGTGTASGNIVEGNVIGLNPDGGSAFGNASYGVYIFNASSNVIGGTASGALNVISGNNDGVYILGVGSTSNQVVGNFIGTGSDGLTDLGNAVDGVVLDNAAGNTIGGSTAGSGNVISGNNGGVRITGVGATGNLVQGNFIGTDLTGTAVIHNETNGVLITAGASNNTIGGATSAAGNTIANNIGAGVNVNDGTGDSVLSNSIFANLHAGIVLNGVTHANHSIVAPVLSSAAPGATVTNVQGLLAGAPNTAYTIQFFVTVAAATPGLEQGQTFLLSSSVVTDASGNALISQDIPVSVPSGQFVTATATNPGGDTSVFSNAVAGVPIALQFAPTSYTVNESDGSATITVSRTGATGRPVSVDYSTGGGTAVAGVDYSTVSATLIFGPLDTSKTFSVPILDAQKVGGSVTLNLALSNAAGGAQIGAASTATLTILDNDVASVRLNSGFAGVNENAGSLTVTVTRNSPIGTSTISYATANGTAVAGVNYTTTTGTLTFNPGQTSQNVTIPILDDHVVAGPLRFTIALSNPVGCVIGAPATTTVTIVNTDGGGGPVGPVSLNITVNTTADETNLNDGTMSLREAIELSNGTLALSALGPNDRPFVTVSPTPTPTGTAPPVPNSIVFNLPGSGIQTINVDPGMGPLPAVTKPVAIVGYSQPGSAINPPDKTEVVVNDARVRIDGSALGAPAIGAGYDGLAIAASNCEVNGLIITGFSGAGISITNTGSQGNWVWGNFLGALPDPITGRDGFEVNPAAVAAAFESPLGNLAAGIRITSSNNRIGGDSPGLPNVICNNGFDVAGNAAGGAGIIILTAGGTGNLIQGNAIFNNAAQGILVESSNNTIGEALRGGGNSIGDNGTQAVEIAFDPLNPNTPVQGNQLLGNFLGTNLGTPDNKVLKGTVAFANKAQGILIQDSPKNTIGGYTSAARNVIGTNLLDGVVITGAASTGNRLLNNYIGFDLINGGISILPNQNGIVITAPGNFIGDSVTGGGNTISSNRNHGILVFGPAASGNTFLGNVIGLNPLGGSAFSNAFDGIHIDNAPNNIIGGITAGSGNTISSNNNGVYIVGHSATGTVLLGNFIGTGTDGVTSLGNAVDGVVIDNAPLNTVGGTAAGAGNVISGNNRGIVITRVGSANNLVQGNFIGTDLTAKSVIHNQIDGILVTAGASNNMIGGLLPGAGNTIAYNAGAGVNLADGTGNAVLTDGIYNNTVEGIVLNPATQANHLQAAPTLSAVIPNGTLTTVEGTFAGAPLTTYTIQFFSSVAKDPSGFGQGQTPVGSFTVVTDSSGNFPIALTLPTSVPSGQWVTSTATDPLGNSSAFSNALPAVPISLQLGAATYSANEGDGAVTITVTRTGGIGGNVAVDFAVGGGTAVAGTDYTATAGTLFFNVGDPPSKTFTIPILNPNKVGGSVTTNITLSNATNGATLGSPASAVLTIIDNAQAGVRLSAATASVNENAGSVVLTVTRNTLVGTMTVAYATGGGTAVPGVNYTAKAGTLTFNPGESSKTVSVPIIDDNFPTGPLTFGFTLSSPTGGIIGVPSSSTVTINNTDTPGTFQVGSAFVTTTPGATATAVTVLRVGGKAGTVTVNYNTGGGSAQANVDYTHVFGTLVFGPGESSKVVTIPLARTNISGPNLTFVFAIGSATGGATVGRLNYTLITIQHNAGTPGPPIDTNPPIVTGLLPLANANGVYGLVVNFSKPMDPVRASQVGNYGYFITAPGPNAVYGDYDDQTIVITRAVYDAANQRAILSLTAPLPLGVFGRVFFNATANAALGQGLVDTTNTLLDGTGTGSYPGSAYLAYVGEGTQLTYTDHSGDVVNLRLSGGGLMALTQGADGEAKQLQLLGALAGRSVLNGSLRRPSRFTGGSTTIGSITGAAGVNVRIGPPTFRIGGISAAAFDSLAATGPIPIGKNRKR